MNAASLLLALALAALIAWAAVRAVRRARKGSACCGEREAGVKRVPVADRDRSHYPYAAAAEITGMTCENCARRVENALNAMDGTWARVRVDTRRAELLLKSPPDEAAIRACVHRAGYGVASLTARAAKP